MLIDPACDSSNQASAASHASRVIQVIQVIQVIRVVPCSSSGSHPGTAAGLSSLAGPN
jgi:hypothetical protein